MITRAIVGWLEWPVVGWRRAGGLLSSGQAQPQQQQIGLFVRLSARVATDRANKTRKRGIPRSDHIVIIFPLAALSEPARQICRIAEIRGNHLTREERTATAIKSSKLLVSLSLSVCLWRSHLCGCCWRSAAGRVNN